MPPPPHAIEPSPPAVARLPGRRFAAFATGLYAALLLFATHHPKPEELVGRPLPSDKLMHFVAYGVLGLLAATTLVAYGRRGIGAMASCLAALAAVAAVDEATQPLFLRAAEPLDWVCDSIGLAVGIAAVVLTTLISSWAWAPGNRRT